MISIYVLSPSRLQQSHVLCDEAHNLIDAIVVARRCGRQVAVDARRRTALVPN